MLARSTPGNYSTTVAARNHLSAGDLPLHPTECKPRGESAETLLLRATIFMHSPWHTRETGQLHDPYQR